MRFFKKKVKRDRMGFYHTVDCPYRNRLFTVINNDGGIKVPECRYKYCFYCGTMLR